MDDALARLGLTRRTAVRLPSFSAVLALVAATDLVTTLPRRLATAVGAGFDVVQVPCPVAVGPFRMVLYWPARRRDDPGHRWLRERLAAVCAAL